MEFCQLQSEGFVVFLSDFLCCANEVLPVRRTPQHPIFPLSYSSPCYLEAKKAYAVVATSEKALYANVILKKGVL